MATGVVPPREYQELLACYRRLGAPPDSSPAALKTCYRTLAKRWHPDKHARTAEDVALAEEKMKAINLSYRRIKHAPLASIFRARPTSRGHSPGRVAWDWEGLARAKGFPTGQWVTQCAGCHRPVTATGIRYVECHRCGMGFFPDVEDPRAGPPESMSWQKKLGFAALSALAGVIHLQEVSPRAGPGEFVLALVLSFLVVGVPLAFARE